MPKQVNNEHAVYCLAVALRDYDRANPDVGMGPSDSYFVLNAAKQLGLELTDFDVNAVDAYMRKSR